VTDSSQLSAQCPGGSGDTAATGSG
jgi:hypothetical protein